MTDQADDLSGDRPKISKKRALVLTEPDLNEVAPLSNFEEIEGLPTETYDDIYDDIDDIDDFDAFEMDNGLTGDGDDPDHLQPSTSRRPQEEDRQDDASILTWNRRVDLGQLTEHCRPTDDEDDFKPVPLMRTATADAKPHLETIEPDRDRVLRLDQISAEKASSDAPDLTAPDASRNRGDASEDRHGNLAPEIMFVETDKLPETTNPGLQEPQAADQPKDTSPPDAPRRSGPGFAPTFKPELETVRSEQEPIRHTGDHDDVADDGLTSDADQPAFGLRPLGGQADFDPLFFSPSPGVQDLESSDDVLPALIIAEAPRLRRFAAAVIGDEDEADQLVEAALRHAIANPGDLAPDVDLSVSLFAIFYRQRREKLQKFDQLLMPSLNDDFASVLFKRLPGADRDEIREFAEAISSLGEEDRAILILISLENFGYRDIAEILGIRADRVMPQIAQAREQLRHALDALAPDASSEATFGDIA